MILNSISIKNYRNLNSITTDLSPNGNLIIESNGRGKTNLLEAIYYLLIGSTFRSIYSLKELIEDKKNFLRIETNWEGNIIELVISNVEDRMVKKLSINGKATNLAKVREERSVILFAPHSVNIINGEPSLRRDDLDVYLSFCSKDYLNALRKYKTLMRNRNVILKNLRDKGALSKELDYWTIELAKTASIIYSFRCKFFSEIKDYLNSVAQELYHKYEKFELVFKPNIQSPSTSEFNQILLQKYRDNQEKEIIVGKTLYGTHKDDYEIYLNNQSMRYMGSRGEQRIASFILKIAQYRYLYGITSNKSLVLIDDLMSELDDLHRQNITTFLLDQDFQFILTGADKKEIPEELIKSVKTVCL